MTLKLMSGGPGTSPFAARQRITCSGSVQASKTRSRGASKKRVITSSSAVDAMIDSVRALIRLLPALKLIELAGRAVEALDPEALVLPDPIVDGLETLAAQAVEALLPEPRTLTKPTCRNTRRCLETCVCLRPSDPAMPVTDGSPRASKSRSVAAEVPRQR